MGRCSYTLAQRETDAAIVRYYSETLISHDRLGSVSGTHTESLLNFIGRAAARAQKRMAAHPGGRS